MYFALIFYHTTSELYEKRNKDLDYAFIFIFSPPKIQVNGGSTVRRKKFRVEIFCS